MTKSPVPIIVTRAEPGASETAERLETLGLEVICAPMLALKPLSNTPLPAPETISGLVFTSANGVRTYAARESDRTHTAWCVGPATARAAREFGFEHVEESAGNADDLAKYIADRKPKTFMPLLHVANRAAAGNLKTALEQSGHSVAFAPIYEMLPAKRAPESVERTLFSRARSVVLFHSEKGALAFADLMSGHELSNCIGIAISKRAATPLEPLNFAAIYTAETPNEDGLFDALKAGLATLSA